MVAHACNISTWEVKEASLFYLIDPVSGKKKKQQTINGVGLNKRLRIN